MRYLVSVFLILLPCGLLAQDSPFVKIPVADSAFPRHVISAGVGQSYWSADLKYGRNWNGWMQDNNRIIVDIQPVWMIGYDLYVKRNISIGLLAATQKVEHTQTFEFPGEETRKHSQTIQTKALNFRTLFHYGTDRLNMYSGIGMGYLKTEVRHGPYPDKINDPYVDINFYIPEDDVFTFQLILFGARYWVLPSVAFRVEFSLGYPNYSSAGLSYRF